MKPCARSCAVAAVAGFPSTFGTASTLRGRDRERHHRPAGDLAYPRPASSAKTLPGREVARLGRHARDEPPPVDALDRVDCDWLITLGTSTLLELFLSSSRVSSQSASRPPSTRAGGRSSHGQTSGPRGGGGGGGSRISSSTTVPGGAPSSTTVSSTVSARTPAKSWRHRQVVCPTAQSPNLLFKKSFQFAYEELIRAAFTAVHAGSLRR